MKKVVKISEKKLINFIKKSLNEYNNKMINKTNIVLNEQNNNDGWEWVETEREFNTLKNKGGYKFRPTDEYTTLGGKSVTFYKKKSEENAEEENKKKEEEVELTPEEKKEKLRQKDIEEAWEAAQIYGSENGLYMREEFDSEGNEINYYTINGIKYYNDGFKVNGKNKVRYGKNDEIFNNPPNIKIEWRKSYPCVPIYGIEKSGAYDAKTNFWTIENVIYKPTGKKSLDKGNSWVDFYCSDDELKNYIEPKKETPPPKKVIDKDRAFKF
jgi:hypothetical protein